MNFYQDILPWILSGITIVMTHYQGNMQAKAWLIGLCGQVGWFVFTLGTGAYGFLPLNITLTYLYVRNYQKWRTAKCST